MELTRQWCDNPTCADFDKVGAGNIKVFSYVEQRGYCTTCRRTFSADKHTFFETIRSHRSVVTLKPWPFWVSAIVCGLWPVSQATRLTASSTGSTWQGGRLRL